MKTDGFCDLLKTNGEIIPDFPKRIFTGLRSGGHIQGIAVDKKRRVLYCSFTTELLKLDFNGNLLGSVQGLTGHLGCLCLHPIDGRVYGSLELKNDAIGKGILRRQGLNIQQPDVFYVAVFDGERITRPNMDAGRDGVMTTVCLRDVAEDYAAHWTEDGKERVHRYGCSGIDGISFGPPFGQDASRGENQKDCYSLYVAYGVYSDLSRTDNDYQVLLRYDVSRWKGLEQPLNQENIHRSGPAHFDARYFVYTGNTTYGVQNLEYDPFTGCWFMAVYQGEKPQFPNRSFYIVDGRRPPQLEPLRGMAEKGLELSLLQKGLAHPSGVWGWDFPYGSTGIAALGEGLYYFSEDRKEGERYCADICLYRWTGEPEAPFRRVEGER